jgi:hypothetical protein
MVAATFCSRRLSSAAEQRLEAKHNERKPTCA